MATFLVYEFVSGGGFLEQPWSSVPESLLAEGTAMRDAIAADLAAIPHADVHVLQDARLPRPATNPAPVELVVTTRERDDAIIDFAARADWTVVIAPECDGHLQRVVRQVLNAGGRLLGPGLEPIVVASDKHALAEHLRRHGVPAPCGRVLCDPPVLPDDFSYPAVLKPVDGAGSIGVQLVPSATQVPTATSDESRAVWRLEEYVPGKPVSVAVLCGEDAHRPLPACRQHLLAGGRFAYLGGSLPLPLHENARAQDLAVRAVRTLPGTLGYVGVDLVLGDEDSGTRDVVIEVNPRLTTSYVGLRAASRENVAVAMIDVAEGRAPRLRFDDAPIRFFPNGRVEPDQARRV